MMIQNEVHYGQQKHHRADPGTDGTDQRWNRYSIHRGTESL